MGFLDDAKDLADKGMDAAADHKDTIKDGIDKGADVARDKTGGKYDVQVVGIRRQDGRQPPGFVNSGCQQRFVV